MGEFLQGQTMTQETSEDFPGLLLEDEDLDRLKERVKETIPELLWINK